MALQVSKGVDEDNKASLMRQIENASYHFPTRLAMLEAV